METFSTASYDASVMLHMESGQGLGTSFVYNKVFDDPFGLYWGTDYAIITSCKA